MMNKGQIFYMKEIYKKIKHEIFLVQDQRVLKRNKPSGKLNQQHYTKQV